MCARLAFSLPAFSRSGLAPDGLNQRGQQFMGWLADRKISGEILPRLRLLRGAFHNKASAARSTLMQAALPKNRFR